MVKKGIFLFLLSACSGLAGAQSDSTFQLRPEKLTIKDLVARKAAGSQSVAISATRTVEAANELPWTVWIITADDILLNGFVTLADVLRAAPGIRVSQPGNAVEGETFLMRGLPGNRYVKILINDVPVKPVVAYGMPLAAQLPVRQAERIEVLYGPAAAIYGDEACAGVVNIILKESERPIFTQADLGFGILGYNSLDLMLGGKIGKDKRIFRFSLFGSSTVQTETDILYDQSIFNTSRYLPFGLDNSLFLQQPGNFRPSNLDSLYPKTVPVPRESRMFGANLTWRGLRFNYLRMGRSDFAALGLNPLALSWSDPSGLLSDRLETFVFGFNLNRRKFRINNNLSVLRYQVNKNSAASYIFDGPDAAVFVARQAEIVTGADRDRVLREIYNRYNSQERYFTAGGLDVRWESVLHTIFSENFSFDAGAQLGLTAGTPLQGHFRLPVDLDLTGSSNFTADSTGYRPYTDADFNGNLFGQFNLKLGRFRLNGGSGLQVSVFEPAELLPRVAVSYRIDTGWTVLANFSQGLRRPSMYEKANTFVLQQDQYLVHTDSSLHRLTERVHSLEGGFRYSGSSSSGFEITAFGQNVYNLSRPGQLYRIPALQGPDSVWIYGYRNRAGLSQQLWGIQTKLSFDTDRINVNLGKGRQSYMRLRMEYYIQYARGREWIGPGQAATVDALNVPRWNTQFRLMVQGPKLHIMAATNRQTQALSKSVGYQDIYQRSDVLTYYPKFRTWDFMVRFYLNNHFLLYCHITNVFDRGYSGLDATGTPDDLLYNPQPGRIVKFGVNYNMN